MPATQTRTHLNNLPLWWAFTGQGGKGVTVENLKAKLDRILHPKVVAVVGAKKDSDYRWLVCQGTLKDGKVYAVNIDRSEWPGAEALGFTNVPSLLDIPEEVDYVIVTVPDKVTPVIMKDIVAKRAGGVHFYTAGFSETGTPEGTELEGRLIEMATDAQIPLLGPNCLGIYHPKVGLRQSPDQVSGDGGSFGYLSQSGTQAIAFSMHATATGLSISKSFSFGNGGMLDCPDLLEYLAQDEDTEIIGMYLEGLRDARRLFKTLKAAAREKPVLVWKVGLTEDAARAAASHTGSQSPPEALWDAMMRQCGAVKVGNVEQMVDTAKALLHLPPLPGARAALLAISGGHASEMTEVFSGAGFRVPAIAEASFEEIASYATRAGGSFHNPFEGPSVRSEENLLRTLSVIEKDPSIDFVVVEVMAGANARAQASLEGRFQSIRKARTQFQKPLAVVLNVSNPLAVVDVNKLARDALEGGIVAFWGMARAARALHNALDYHWQQAWLYG